MPTTGGWSPGCWNPGRKKLVTAAEPGSSAQVVDLACGPGLLARVLLGRLGGGRLATYFDLGAGLAGPKCASIRHGSGPSRYEVPLLLGGA